MSCENPITNIDTLGTCTLPSPLHSTASKREKKFTSENEKVRYNVEVTLPLDDSPTEQVFLEKAGPREKIFFDPKTTKVAIVTCGGLSPGLNNVVQSLVLELSENYKLKEIYGIMHGFLGFLPDAKVPPVKLSVEDVLTINELGGSILGSSRGPVDPSVIVDQLVSHKINILFCIGGNGTQNGAAKITEEIQRRKLPISVIGIPKTIDNDVPYVWQTFGFLTAVEQARDVISGAVLEARAYMNSVCIVKLMGRDSGFISVMATLAAQNVDFTLIPEVAFDLYGEHGILQAIEKKLSKSGYAVVVISEGAGQEFFTNKMEHYDLSGNRLQHDVGLFLKDQVTFYLKNRGVTPTIKYFDPSYSIRAVPANVSDAYLCDQLARAAVHAAMAGKTNMLIGHWYNNLVHVPIPLVCSGEKRINPDGQTWQHVLAVTGQDNYLS